MRRKLATFTNSPAHLREDRERTTIACACVLKILPPPNPVPSARARVTARRFVAACQQNFRPDSILQLCRYLGQKCCLGRWFDRCCFRWLCSKFRHWCQCCRCCFDPVAVLKFDLIVRFRMYRCRNCLCSAPLLWPWRAQAMLSKRVVFALLNPLSESLKLLVVGK